MQLVSVDPTGSKYTNLDLWSYRCDACANTVANYVAHTAAAQ
jgi:hypothetical protein